MWLLNLESGYKDVYLHNREKNPSPNFMLRREDTTHSLGS